MRTAAFVSAMVVAMILDGARWANAVEGLIRHYGNFAEDSETAVQDLSGRGNDGTTHGAKLVKGVTGTALYFEDGNYVSFGSPADFKFTDKVTLTAWVYLTDIAEGDHSLIVGRQPHKIRPLRACGRAEALYQIPPVFPRTGPRTIRLCGDVDDHQRRNRHVGHNRTLDLEEKKGIDGAKTCRSALSDEETLQRHHYATSI